MTAAIAVLLGVAAALLLWPTALGGETAYVTTHGSSMEPRFHQGDLAIVRGGSRYDIGDVVAYHSHLLHTVVLHRIVAKRGRHYVFKGDHNPWLDRERPTRKDLIGKLWIHLPRVGALVEFAHGKLVVVAAVLGFLAFGGLTTSKRRRQRARTTPEMKRLGDSGIPPGALRAIAIALALVTAGCAALATFAFTRPANAPTGHAMRYSQRGTFSYSATAPVSAAYPDGRVGTGDPVYLRIVGAVGVQFAYHFESSLPHAIRGTLAMSAEISDTKGWKYTLGISPATPFRGDSAQSAGTLDIATIQRLIANVQATTGVRDSLYTVTVTADARIAGSLDRLPVKTAYGPPLAFELDDTQLRVAKPSGAAESPVRSTQRGLVPASLVGPANMTVLLATIRVADARLVALVVGILAAAGTAIALSALRRRLHSEVDRIALRYHSRLVPATHATIQANSPIVDVERIDDLVRVSEHTDTLITHRESSHGHVYLCFADNATYRYVAPSTLPRQSSPPQGPPPANSATTPEADSDDSTAPRRHYRPLRWSSTR